MQQYCAMKFGSLADFKTAYDVLLARFACEKTLIVIAGYPIVQSFAPPKAETIDFSAENDGAMRAVISSSPDPWSTIAELAAGSS